MGLFQHKHAKSLSEKLEEAEELLFDDAFREELKAHGREYFERVINENAALFKQDLDATVSHINTELRQHVARQLDQQFADINRVNSELREHIVTKLDEQLVTYNETMKQAQNAALHSLEQRAKALEEQYQGMRSTLEKSIAHQDAMLTGAVTEAEARLGSITRAQEAGLQSLSNSIKSIEEQHRQLNDMLEKSIADQEAMMINAFEENMARIIEQYLIAALGDQYDLKAQLPAIIQQMEQNKQAMVDDMKL